MEIHHCALGVFGVIFASIARRHLRLIVDNSDAQDGRSLAELRRDELEAYAQFCALRAISTTRRAGNDPVLSAAWHRYNKQREAADRAMAALSDAGGAGE